MGKNIAVIGSGYWGKNLVRNFAELGALRTICDSDSNKLESFKSMYPDALLEPDYKKVLCDEKIRGVVIASPAVTHYPIAREALEKGKDIMVEKPLALKIEEGKELVEIAKKKEKILLVGHLLLYHPAIEKLKDLIDRGTLGDIEYIYSNRLNLGKIRTEENILWSFAPHDISVILHLLGDMPFDVSAHGGYFLHKDIADTTLTNFNFTNGVKAHIFVSWLHPYKEQKLVIVGNKKMALFDDTQPKDKLLLYSHEIEWVNDQPIPHQKQAEIISIKNYEPLKLECQDFVNCIETRNIPKVDGAKGLQVLQVLSCCQNSLEQGGKVVHLNTNSDNTFFIHPTGIVEEPGQIGTGTKIWHFCHVMPEVVIGKNCVLGQNVFVGKGVQIGDNVKIENNISVFEGVTLEDDVFCGPSCVFTNVINPRSFVSRKHEYKPTLVKKGASIGANTTIVCGNTVGNYAFIGAGSVVTHDVPDYALVYGNPARIKGWICKCGVKLDFARKKTTECPSCHAKYQKTTNKTSVTVERM